MDAARTPLSEAEFEEIMNRNRAISSSAISRAVSDASAGLYICFSVHSLTWLVILRITPNPGAGEMAQLLRTSYSCRRPWFNAQRSVNSSS